MGQRTQVNLVQEVLGGAYGPVNGQLPNLQPYIDLASNLVTQAVQLAQNRIVNRVVLDATTQELMERTLAAYFYTTMDPEYVSKSTAGVSASFSAEDLSPRRFKAMAMQADPSGTINALLNRKFAGGAHIGSRSDT